MSTEQKTPTELGMPEELWNLITTSDEEKELIEADRRAAEAWEEGQ